MKKALINATLFIGNGDVLDNAGVVIDHGTIAKVLKAEDQPPPDLECIDLSGKMLFPGFIDCHVHLCLDGSADPMTNAINDSPAKMTLKAARHARDTLMAGVTTVRDMGAFAGIDTALRDAVAAGQMPGPRILAAGRVICMTGGHGWQLGGREADGPDEVRRAAREQIKAGCDHVKLMATGGVLTPGVDPGSTQLTKEELRAGIEEAHKAGRLTSAHAQGRDGILNSLWAGIDSIEHGIFLDQQAMELMLERGVPLVPTLAPGLNVLAKGVEAGVPSFAVEKNKWVVPQHLQMLEMAHDGGVCIASGTDAGTPFNRHGANLAEIVNLAQNGLSPSEALCAATGIAAQVLGLEQEIGLIKEGMAADLVAVSGNPLEQIDLLLSAQAIHMVMQGGRIVRQD
ncbi:MAG: amidohydrolase family protein [Desulfarculaceae bacterium]|jgi:imidazolonepropionase-like amidohydrolase